MEVFGMLEKITELLSITHTILFYFLAILLELRNKAI